MNSSGSKNPPNWPQRAQAETLPAQGMSVETLGHPADELLRELQLRQVELEMQNETLRCAQIALEESRDRYVDLYDFAPVGYLSLTDAGMIAAVNVCGALLMGAERSKLLQHPFARFVSAADAGRWHLYFNTVLHAEEKLDCELALQHADGLQVHVRLDSRRLVKDGQTPAVRVVMTDITERNYAQNALREQEDFFRMIAENIGDFIAVVDLDGRRLYNSPSYMQLFDGTRTLRGTDSFAEIHPDDRERVKQIFRETVRTGVGKQIEYRFQKSDGSFRIMESRGDVIKDGEGQVVRVVVVSHDITERKRMEEQVQQLAFFDTLTSLPNRRLLNDRLTLAMAASKRSGSYGALMFIDMDNFKPLNDTHGHEVGDLLLVEAADRLKRCVREMDTVARFGGDEFVVMLGELNTGRAESTVQAETVAEKIRATLSEPYLLPVRQEGHANITVEHHCTASIGVVLFNNHQAPQGDILKWADMAMYQAKGAGRNLIRFYDSDACVTE